MCVRCTWPLVNKCVCYLKINVCLLLHLNDVCLRKREGTQNTGMTHNSVSMNKDFWTTRTCRHHRSSFLFLIFSLIINASRRDRQWFWFIWISSSIWGWGWERTGLTAVCESLNKDAAMTAVLTEQWNISVLISLDLYSTQHPFQRAAELCTHCVFATSDWL